MRLHEKDEKIILMNGEFRIHPNIPSRTEIFKSLFSPVTTYDRLMWRMIGKSSLVCTGVLFSACVAAWMIGLIQDTKINSRICLLLCLTFGLIPFLVQPYFTMWWNRKKLFTHMPIEIDKLFWGFSRWGCAASILAFLCYSAAGGFFLCRMTFSQWVRLALLSPLPSAGMLVVYLSPAFPLIAPNPKASFFIIRRRVEFGKIKRNVFRRLRLSLSAVFPSGDFEIPSSRDNPEQAILTGRFV